MKYIEAKIASADEVRAAAREGLKLESACLPHEVETGAWYLQVLFTRGQICSYEGRMFRAPSELAARERARHQLKKLLGQTSRMARKLSPQFIAARQALEAKIDKLWDERTEQCTDLVKPGRIKMDWTRREPLLKVFRFTSPDALYRRYDPELSAFRQVSMAETAPPS